MALAKLGARYSEETKEQARQLKAEGLSNRQIADRLLTQPSTVRRWLSAESEPAAKQPPAGTAPTEAVGAAGGGGHPAAGEPPAGRAHERTPKKPQDGKVQPRPTVLPDGEAQLDFNAIGSYIEGAYRLSAKLARERGDALLASVIDEHASPAARAWVRWIQSEPKVAEMLRKLMVGTPAGEVIAIHVSIVFSYTLARGAASQLAAAAAEREAAEPAPA